MQINKRLIIDGQSVPVENDMVRLRLNQVGEASFDIPMEANWRHRPLVEMYAALNTREEYLMFTGAVVKVERIKPGMSRLHCKELSIALQLAIAINKVRVRARDVIALVEQKTGLHFLLPAKAPYLDEIRVNFQFSGSCLDALETVRARWGLKDTVWYQLPDGRMYFGHWTQGPFNAAPVPIEPRLITAQDPSKSALVLPYIPALRPGMLVESNINFRLDSLVFTRDQLQVLYKKVGK